MKTTQLSVSTYFCICNDGVTEEMTEITTIIEDKLRFCSAKYLKCKRVIKAAAYLFVKIVITISNT